MIYLKHLIAIKSLFENLLSVLWKWTSKVRLRKDGCEKLRKLVIKEEQLQWKRLFTGADKSETFFKSTLVFAKE